MLLFGVILILLGALAVVAGVFANTGEVSFLGQDISAMTLFLIGLGAGVAILWGFSISRFGAKRSLKQRRESRQLAELSDKLDKVEEAKRRDPGDETP